MKTRTNGRWLNGWNCDVEVKLQLYSESMRNVTAALSSATGNTLAVGCYFARIAEQVGAFLYQRSLEILGYFDHSSKNRHNPIKIRCTRCGSGDTAAAYRPAIRHIPVWVLFRFSQNSLGNYLMQFTIQWQTINLRNNKTSINHWLGSESFSLW
jgi:hypothetical protein